MKDVQKKKALLLAALASLTILAGCSKKEKASTIEPITIEETIDDDNYKRCYYTSCAKKNTQLIDDANNDTIRTIKEGEIVTVEVTNGKYDYVIDEFGNLGYVKSDDFTILDTKVSNITPHNRELVIITQDSNVYMPDLKTVSNVVNKNTYSRILGECNDYYLIELTLDNVGYISKNNVYFTQEINRPARTLGTAETYLDIKNGTQYSIIEEGQAINIIRDDGEYFLASTFEKDPKSTPDNILLKETFFYVKKSIYAEFLPSTFVVGDKSDQLLYLYKDYELVYYAPTCMGRDSKPTVTGYFDIDYKASPFTFRSGVTCNYWMPYDYDSEQGIHDAPWDKDNYYLYGTDYYKTNGSGGCVRTTGDGAKVFYENLDVGDMVLIQK